MDCLVDLPARGETVLAILLASFAVLSFACFVPAAITRNRSRWWLLCATVVLLCIAAQCIELTSLIGGPSVSVRGDQIILQTNGQTAQLDVQEMVWSGVRRTPPLDLRPDRESTGDDDTLGWHTDRNHRRVFVAGRANPALLRTTAGFDLVMDWNTYFDLESCALRADSDARLEQSQF